MAGTLQDIYATTQGYQQGPAAGYPVPAFSGAQYNAGASAAAPGPAGSTQDAAGSTPNGPAVSWVVVAGVYFLIRFLYERGGRAGGPVTV